VSVDVGFVGPSVCSCNMLGCLEVHWNLVCVIKCTAYVLSLSLSLSALLF
jgi:hypothetical protein